MTLRYPVGTSGEQIHLVLNVLEHFEHNRQTRFWQKEAGGQIFARLEGSEIIVEQVTGPKESDKRSRYSHASCRSAAQAEVDAHYMLGLHYLGDWHTHPELIPSPSWRDKMTMASRVRSSKHRLRGFLFIIVGTGSFPVGLAVLAHDGTCAHRLTAQ